MKTIVCVFIPILILSAFCYPSHNVGASGFGTHGVVGGALGYSVAQTDLQAFVLGLTSHALLDMMPHHDPKITDPFDVTFHVFFNLGALFTIEKMYNVKDHDSRLLWGVIGGIIPDLEHLIFLGQCGTDLCPAKIFPAHNGLLPHRGSAPLWQGYLYETSLIVISLALVF